MQRLSEPRGAGDADHDDRHDRVDDDIAGRDGRADAKLTQHANLRSRHIAGDLRGLGLIYLKGSDLLPLRDAVTAAVESRHLQVRTLWTELLAGIDVKRKEAG